MEVLAANLRFGAGASLGGAGEPLCDRESAPVLGVGLLVMDESPSASSSSTSKLSFGVPALRFGFFFGGSEGVEPLY
jgi:hypothetical protein